MNRRKFLPSAVFLMLIITAFAFPCRAYAENLVFIYIDDMNLDLGAYGHPIVQTPNIDSLAAESVLFENAYPSNPVCKPSRTSMLSGRNVMGTQVADNRDPVPELGIGDTPYLPNLLRAHGYHTAAVGKIFHHPGDNPSSWDEQFDFNHDPGPTRPRYPGNQYTPRLLLWGPYENGSGTTEKMDDTKRTDKFIELLQQWASQPGTRFAGFLGLIAPHQPAIYPERFASLYHESQVPALPPEERSGRWKDHVQPQTYHNILEFPEAYRGNEEQGRKSFTLAYWRTLTYMDEQVGRVVDALRRLGLYENTTVVFLSDHGFSLGWKDHYGKNKGWDRDAQGPMLIKAKRSERISPTRVSQPVSHLDIYPTLVELLDLTAPPGLDGDSLTAVMRNPRAPHAPTEFISAQSQHTASLTRWIVDETPRGRVKLGIWEGYGPRNTLKHQYYDLGADPGEYTNRFLDPRFRTEIEMLRAKMRASGFLGPQLRSFGPFHPSSFGEPKLSVQGIPVPGATITVRIDNPYTITTRAALFKSFSSLQDHTLPGGAKLLIRDPSPIVFELPPEGIEFRLTLPSNFDENTALMAQLLLSSDAQGTEISASRGLSILMNPMPPSD